jgi:hypothetical protein
MNRAARTPAFLRESSADVIEAAECYRSAVEKAADYFESLHEQVVHKTYAPILTKDIRLWRQSRIHRRPFLSRCFGRNHQPDPRDYGQYVQWLYRTTKLDCYLDRSRHTPKEVDAEHAQRKLIKIIAGVLMHEVEEMGNDISREERARRLTIIGNGGDDREKAKVPCCASSPPSGYGTTR